MDRGIVVACYYIMRVSRYELSVSSEMRAKVIRKTAVTVLLIMAAVAACDSTDPTSRDAGSPDGSTIKFLTYNVGQDNWSQARAKRIAAIIDGQMPDIVTLHEVGVEEIQSTDGRTTSVRSDLEAQLSDDYDFYFPESLDPILVLRVATLRKVAEGSLGLFECRFPRAANWLRFEETRTGKEFVIYNTHLCPWVMPYPEGELSAEERNQLEANEIVELMASQGEPGLLQFLAGDLNAVPESNTIQYLLHGVALPVNDNVSPLQLVDTWAAAPGNVGTKPVTTDPDLDALMPRGDMTYREAGITPFTLDWLIAVEHAEIEAAEVLDNEMTDGASDHLPVTATVRL